MLSIVGSKETVQKLAQSWEAIDLEAVKSLSFRSSFRTVC